MKACVFVDGENFRHVIVDLFKPEFQQHDYLPENAKWTELFDWFVDQAFKDAQYLRTYWYAIKMLDFYPYNLPNPDNVAGRQEKLDLLRKILSYHKPYQNELDRLEEPTKTQRMVEILKELCKRQSEMEKRFNGWIKVQDGIVSKHKKIEFRRAGAISYNLFERQLGKEKAVDIKLASDIIILKDIYDVAVIVSGDQDYVPAVEIIKDAGKQVVNVSFLTRKGELLPGGAKRLNQITDWHYDMPYDKLKELLRL